jgi:hypothetical protein
MTLTLRSVRREISDDHLWPTAEMKLLAELEHHSGGRPVKRSSEATPKLSDLDEEVRPAGSKNERPLFRRRTGGLTRVLIMFGMGVGATLAWQSYGDEVRATLANSYPQFGWLAPRAALAETAPEPAPIVPATASTEGQQLEVISISLAAMQQSIEQLTAQLVASQQQMASDNARLKQDILAKISSLRPVAAPARKPAPVAAPPSAQEPSER